MSTRPKNVVGFVLIAVTIISFTIIQTFDNANLLTPPITLILFVILGGLSAVGLWIWMFRDLFKRGSMKYKWFWVTVLLLLFYPGAVIYFFFVFVPSRINK
jgi:hypothetical protein